VKPRRLDLEFKASSYGELGLTKKSESLYNFLTGEKSIIKIVLEPSRPYCVPRKLEKLSHKGPL
jgi:hypothetical protein